MFRRTCVFGVWLGCVFRQIRAPHWASASSACLRACVWPRGAAEHSGRLESPGRGAALALVASSPLPQSSASQSARLRPVSLGLALPGSSEVFLRRSRIISHLHRRQKGRRGGPQTTRAGRSLPAAVPTPPCPPVAPIPRLDPLGHLICVASFRPQANRRRGRTPGGQTRACLHAIRAELPPDPHPFFPTSAIAVFE